MPRRTEGVDKKHKKARDEYGRTCADEQVETVPRHVRLVGVDAARHSLQSENVHRKERQVETYEDQPKGPLARTFAHHPPGDLGKPVIDSAQQRKYRAADQHIVEM